MNDTRNDTRTYLVTGATGGIGAAIALRLYGRGDRLLVTARDEHRAAAVRAMLPGCVPVVADLAEPFGIEPALAGTLPHALDGLVHVAGVIELGAVAELGVDAWQRTWAVNVAAPVELTRLALPALRAARGQVVFVNSGSGLRTGARWGSYGASKHALRAVAEALRAEERAHGVRVTSVYPGRTASEMQRKVHDQEGREYRPSDWIDPDSVASTVLAALDLPADAELTDVTVRPRSG